MIGSSRSYAIGMAHYQLAGGIKSLLGVCGAYLLLFFGGLSLYWYATYLAPAAPGPRGGASTGAIVLLTVLEAAALLMFGSNRIAACIRLDMNSRMIESHRLMPIPAWRAVAGYIFGGGAHAIAFALLNLTLAVGVGVFSGTPMSDIVMKQIFLFSFAMLVWSCAAMGTLLAKHAYTVIFVMLAMGGFVAAFWAYVILPGLALLVSPLFNESIFNFTSSPRGFSMAYPASLLCQMGFFAIFFAAACRRYRGTYAQAFPFYLALALLLLWSGASTIGQLCWRDFFFQPAVREFGGQGFYGGQVIGSVLVAMLVGLVPLAASVFDFRGGRPAVAVMTALATIGLITLAGMGGLETTNRPGLASFVWTALIASAYVMTTWGVFLLSAKFKPVLKALMMVGMILALWIGPLVMEMGRMIGAKNRREPEPLFGMLGNLSPIGLLVSTWQTGEYFSRLPGIAFSLIVGMAVMGLALVVHFTGRTKAVPAPGPSDGRLTVNGAH